MKHIFVYDYIHDYILPTFFIIPPSYLRVFLMLSTCVIKSFDKKAWIDFYVTNRILLEAAGHIEEKLFNNERFCAGPDRMLLLPHLLKSKMFQGPEQSVLFPRIMSWSIIGSLVKESKQIESLGEVACVVHWLLSLVVQLFSSAIMAKQQNSSAKKGSLTNGKKDFNLNHNVGLLQKK